MRRKIVKEFYKGLKKLKTTLLEGKKKGSVKRNGRT
jgi:hypothetical protein